MKYLGETIDIHTGGQEHIQVHHSNEIAQSEAATGKPFVRYWLHGAWLLFKGEKVSKSKGGLFTLSELEKKGFDVLAFRYLMLSTHYRKPLNFSLDKLGKAKESYQRLKNIISEIEEDKRTNKKYLDEFQKAINDDLNAPKALQVLWKLLRDAKARGKLSTISKMDEVLGLDLLRKNEKIIGNRVRGKKINLIIYKEIKPTKELTNLINEREKARAKKEWKKADEIRIKIKDLGYKVDDTAKGTLVRKNA
jgi:cysteinyl-tRNA synthetase